MSYLERFAPKQRELIVSLPYRVGLWISESDTSGGDEADEAERNALHLMMTGYAEDFLKSEVVEEIMRRTVSSRESWDQWGAQNNVILEDCAKALSIMDGYIRPDDIVSFRQSLMDIAKTVALAYCEIEEEEMTTADTLKLELLHRLDAFKAKMQGKQQPSKRERLNISPKERAALEKLSQTIKVDLEGKPFPEPEEDKQVPVKDDRRGAADAEHGEEIKTEG
ncbi:MAG: hypothetical protein VXW91_03480 [Pseudomonadota bacterium]|nr:hypothetical protein [Pseudomonadota bacterium]MEC8664923.1 hypothetical protein [Pseudomonadota bacterium]HIF26445.1 hypothetical protein [Micavibrio sp.]